MIVRFLRKFCQQNARRVACPLTLDWTEQSARINIHRLLSDLSCFKNTVVTAFVIKQGNNSKKDNPNRIILSHSNQACPPEGTFRYFEASNL